MLQFINQIDSLEINMIVQYIKEIKTKWGKAHKYYRAIR